MLVPGTPGNYYTEFQIVPPGLEDKLRQGQTCRVLIRNWHKLDWESEEQILKKRSVDKRGAKAMKLTSAMSWAKWHPRRICWSRFYHIYNDPEVKTDVNRKAEPQAPLLGLVSNSYYFLGKDWLEAAKAWKKAKQPTPPVMITVANTTHTAARVEFAFTHKRINIEELCDPDRILHIESSVLKKAEEEDEPVQLGLSMAESDEDSEETNGVDGSNDNLPEKKLSKKEKAELLRRQVDTVGLVGQPGEKIQNVISVGMLSEGWDAKTVTHIMGLRAFTSQLLCEQVVGRGLRRTSYESDEKSGLFQPEYVNIFDVPFTFLPHEGGGDEPPPPPPARKQESRRYRSAKGMKSFAPTSCESITNTGLR